MVDISAPSKAEPSVRTPTETLALSLQPIQTADSLRNQAYAMLKQAIADTDIYSFPDEVQLDKRVLTEALGVSRTPVREAMTLLEQEGFLRTFHARASSSFARPGRKSSR